MTTCPHCHRTREGDYLTGGCDCEAAHLRERHAIIDWIRMEDTGSGYVAVHGGRRIKARDAWRDWLEREKQRQEMYAQGLKPPGESG